MKTIGLYLVIGGVGSIVLNLVGYEFVVLMWIDTWGETVGWAIRGSAIIVGAILWFLGKDEEPEETEEAEEAQEA
jgi:hypothetical protein